MFGNRKDKNADDASKPQPGGPLPGASKPLKQPRLTRPQIMGAINSVIDLYSDATLIPPKLGNAPRILPPKVPPLQLSLVMPQLPKSKRRGDAMLDVLCTLRTYVKYGLLDRDALRREVAYLKKLVEESGGDA